MIRLTRKPCPNTNALKTNYKHPENKAALKESTYNKCMYCESKVDHISPGDVEHILPKSKFSHLEYDWENLGYCCANCNNNKRDKHFPDTEFINPFREEPSDYLIALGAFYATFQGSERGDLTILEIGLNRPPLIQRRHEIILSIQKAIDACFRSDNQTIKANALKCLLRDCEPDKEFSFFIKAVFKANNLL